MCDYDEEELERYRGGGGRRGSGGGVGSGSSSVATNGGNSDVDEDDDDLVIDEDEEPTMDRSPSLQSQHSSDEAEYDSREEDAVENQDHDDSSPPDGSSSPRRGRGRQRRPRQVVQELTVSNHQHQPLDGSHRGGSHHSSNHSHHHNHQHHHQHHNHHRQQQHNHHSFLLQQEIEYGREDAIRLIAALADEASSSKIRTVSISRSLQYALFYFSMTAAAAANANAPVDPSSSSTGSGSHNGRNGNDPTHRHRIEQQGEGRDEVEGMSDVSDRSGGSGNGSGNGDDGGLSSLSMLLSRVGILPNLRELLIEGEDRITQFVSTGTLPGVFVSIQPCLHNLQRIHIDAMLALPTQSIPTLALCLSGAVSLVDLTLSQLHFPHATRSSHGSGSSSSRSSHSVSSGSSGSSGSNGSSLGGGSGHDFLLPLLRSLAALDRLRSLHLGCVVDHASESALTPDGLQALVRRPSSIQVLKLDSFRVTDAHLAVLRDIFVRNVDGRGRSRASPPTPAAGRTTAAAFVPSALESLCLYRCENPQFTEHGCQSILRMLETRHACNIQYLFVSPRALQSAWKSSHPSEFQKQVRLLCLLNQIRRGQPPSSPESESGSAGASANSSDRLRRHWIKVLATCSSEVNASYSILIKCPDIVRAPTTTEIAPAEGPVQKEMNGETLAPSQEAQPDAQQQDCSKRRRTGSVSSPT